MPDKRPVPAAAALERLREGNRRFVASLADPDRPREDQSPNLAAIVNRVRPAVETLLRIGIGDDHDALVRHAVRANVATSVDHLRHGSALLEKAIQEDGLAVVGAEYSLHTGEVTFFDD